MANFANWRTTLGKRHKSEEIIAKLRQVEVMTGQGTSMADAIRSIGVTEVASYRHVKLMTDMLDARPPARGA